MTGVYNRILPLDGLLLDGQVNDILNDLISGIFKDNSLPLEIQRLVINHKIDINLIVKLILYKFFIWDKNLTYGLQLQNLKFESKKVNKIRLFFLGMILGDYINQKLNDWVYSADGQEIINQNRKLANLIQLKEKFEKMVRMATFINFLAFLRNGQYMSIFLRIFRIQFEKINFNLNSITSNPQNLSYEFQDRQLIWNSFTELFKFLKVNNSFRTLISRKKQEEAEDSFELLKNLPVRCCAICYRNGDKSDYPLITNPYITDCGCVYCYFCLSNKLNSEFRRCLRCGNDIKFIKGYVDGMEFEDVEDKEEEEESDSDDDNQQDYNENSGTSEDESTDGSDSSDESHSDDSEYEYDADQIAG